MGPRMLMVAATRESLRIKPLPEETDPLRTAQAHPRTRRMRHPTLRTPQRLHTVKPEVIQTWVLTRQDIIGLAAAQRPEVFPRPTARIAATAGRGQLEGITRICHSIRIVVDRHPRTCRWHCDMTS